MAREQLLLNFAEELIIHIQIQNTKKMLIFRDHTIISCQPNSNSFQHSRNSDDWIQREFSIIQINEPCIGGEWEMGRLIDWGVTEKE